MSSSIFPDLGKQILLKIRFILKLKKIFSLELKLKKRREREREREKKKKERIESTSTI